MTIVMKHYNINAGDSMPLPKTEKKFRTARDIVIPAGTRVIYVSRMNHVVTNMASVLVNIGPHKQYDWMMNFDDAVEAGLVEEVA